MTAEPLALARLRADAAYPDYVLCPHCGEPEVEVWSYEKTARCHNCAWTFEPHPTPQLQAAGGEW